MNTAEIQKIWQCRYEAVPQQLSKITEVKRVATAFNTNIDAVLRIDGRRIAELAAFLQLSDADLASTSVALKTGKDVLRGIIKCFSGGIAEEWIAEDKEVYEWMSKHLGYSRLQMGGQGGIVANVLAVSGVQQVIVHTNSHPKLQAAQFLPQDNLLGFDENGDLCTAHSINRADDVPLIHWIIEFAKGDSFEYAGRTYVCPKANRFIATYDPCNLVLKTDENFVRYLQNHEFDYLILSGYHNLTSARNGVVLARESINNIKMWRQSCPQGIIHLELASTQDKNVRRVVLEEIAPLVDSVGLNDREALDALEIVDEAMFLRMKDDNLSSTTLFEILVRLKEAFGVARIQLHFFGLYVTLQDKEFRISKEQNLQGMMLAATVAASKALTGKVEIQNALLTAMGKPVDLSALQELGSYLEQSSLLEHGFGCYQKWDIIAVPTIIIEKPVTLVGMGDTISSLSLVSAR